jgi:hypothetical protein
MCLLAEPRDVGSLPSNMSYQKGIWCRYRDPSDIEIGVFGRTDFFLILEKQRLMLDVGYHRYKDRCHCPPMPISVHQLSLLSLSLLYWTAALVTISLSCWKKLFLSLFLSLSWLLSPSLFPLLFWWTSLYSYFYHVELLSLSIFLALPWWAAVSIPVPVSVMLNHCLCLYSCLRHNELPSLSLFCCTSISVMLNCYFCLYHAELLSLSLYLSLHIMMNGCLCLCFHLYIVELLSLVLSLSCRRADFVSVPVSIM